MLGGFKGSRQMFEMPFLLLLAAAAEVAQNETHEMKKETEPVRHSLT